MAKKKRSVKQAKPAHGGPWYVVAVRESKDGKLNLACMDADSTIEGAVEDMHSNDGTHLIAVITELRRVRVTTAVEEVPNDD